MLQVTSVGLLNFYPYVTTLRYVRVFAIGNPCVVCLSVTFVYPTQEVETFGNISSPFYILAIIDLRPTVTPPSGALNARAVAKQSDVTFGSLVSR